MMALDNNYFLFPQQQPLFGWDPHSIGVGEQLHELSDIIPLDVAEPPMSSGYLLQDAVAQWSDRCKRRRLASSMLDDDPKLVTEGLHDLIQWQGFWGSSWPGDLNCLVEDNNTISGDSILQNYSPPPQLELFSPPTSNAKEPENSNKKESKSSSRDPMLLKDKRLGHGQQEEGEEEKKKKKKRVVYPFAVLKPVGLEGDVTLDDINERILMRPTRPVKHPVGEFALGPCVSAGGPGLSGKVVVGLTRIHTQGRGTITIIRTRG